MFSQINNQSNKIIRAFKLTPSPSPPPSATDLTHRNAYEKISGVDWLTRKWILAQSEPDPFCVGGG